MTTSLHTPGPAWSTSCYGQASDITPMQTEALGEHFASCTRSSGRWPMLAQGMESMRGFVGCRLVTSMAVLTVIGAACLIWI